MANTGCLSDVEEQMAITNTIRMLKRAQPDRGKVEKLFAQKSDQVLLSALANPEHSDAARDILQDLADARGLQSAEARGWARTEAAMYVAPFGRRPSFEEALAAPARRRRIYRTLQLIMLVGLIFGWLLQQSTADFDSGFRLKLAVSVLISILWLGAGVLVAAISLGALAGVLNLFYGAADRSLPVRESVIGLRGLLIGFSTLSLIGLIWVTVLIDDVESETTVEIIAHRGAAGLRPENTLASIRKAIEDGTDWVEIDVQETADGEVVVLHDSDFMKLAGVNLKIWDATMDDLADIDIGSWFDAVYSEERTPRLAEVLEAVRDKAGLLIELKYYGHDVDLEARTIALVEEAGMMAQVATMSLKYPAVQKMKTLRPDWPSGVLAATAVGNLAQLDGEFIAVSTALVGPKLVRATHAKGKKLFVWTVNDPLEMMSMLSMGVDGLITDEPALARKVIDIRADLSTPERVFILFMERFNLTAPEDRYRDASP